MPEPITRYRVFIASPSGLEQERGAFRAVVEHVNGALARHFGLSFHAVGWEDGLGIQGRPQSQINEELVACDYFVLALWDRWGSSPDPKGVKGYSAASEEEYALACQCVRDDDRPMREIVVLFKSVHPRQLADPGEQLSRVLEFRRELEQSKRHWYKTFDDVNGFKAVLSDYLNEWIAWHARKSDGRAPSSTRPAEGPVAAAKLASVPPIAENGSAVAGEDLARAETLAREGRLREAEQRFAEAITTEPSPERLDRYGQFLFRIGRFAQAGLVFEQMLECAEAGSPWAARAKRRLGNLAARHGRLDEAEALYREALSISEALGSRRGIADDSASLGLVHLYRDEYDEAERAFTKARSLHEGDSQDGLAKDYCNLGIIAARRGDHGKAVEWIRKAAELNERLDNEEELAIDYGNLGQAYRDLGLASDSRAHLETARHTFERALEINHRLGRLEGLANQKANLARLHLDLGDPTEARRFAREARATYLDIGLPEGARDMDQALAQIDAAKSNA